jgi:hypothetical protein
MALTLLADLVLGLHLLLAALITVGLVLVPVGGLLNWGWVRNRVLRLAHVSTMLFVAIEAVLGLTCPLTIMESALRNEDAPTHFLAVWMVKALYWNASPEFFVLLYLLCAAWAVSLWALVPPRQRGDQKWHINLP